MGVPRTETMLGVAAVGLAVVCVVLLTTTTTTATAATATPGTPGAGRGVPRARGPFFVNTTLGGVQGRAGDHCVEFLGIPYAEAPLGNLRFRPAQAVRSWAPAVIDATNTGLACTQPSSPDLPMSGEDCLFLNIFTPVRNASKQELLPVMFWIHGGGFFFGTGATYNGSKLAQQGVVVVTINYRLGILGQLASEEIRDEEPFVRTLGGANFLSDQLTALQWVRDQIGFFGGDKDQITLFGESAGSLSVCMIAASPLSKGKFKNVVLQSGACVGPWGPYTSEFGLGVSRQFFQAVGVSTIRELRTLSVKVILDAQAVTAVGPSVDGFFLSKPPNETFSAQTFSLGVGGRAMLGATTMDGVMPEPYFEYGHDLPNTETGFKDALVTYFGDLSKLPDGTTVVDEAVRLYPPSPNATQSYIQINSDVCVVCPTRAMALELSSGKRDTFVYSFGFSPQDHGLAAHATDLDMVFGYPWLHDLMQFPFNETLSLPLREAWTSFAKGGAVAAGGVQWPRFMLGEDSFLNISSSALAVVRGFKHERCALWEQVGRRGWEDGGRSLAAFCLQTTDV